MERVNNCVCVLLRVRPRAGACPNFPEPTRIQPNRWWDRCPVYNPQNLPAPAWSAPFILAKKWTSFLVREAISSSAGSRTCPRTEWSEHLSKVGLLPTSTQHSIWLFLRTQTVFSTKKHPELITDRLTRCLVRQNYLRLSRFGILCAYGSKKEIKRWWANYLESPCSISIAPGIWYQQSDLSSQRRFETPDVRLKYATIICQL